jgi:hypothetical protein
MKNSASTDIETYQNACPASHDTVQECNPGEEKPKDTDDDSDPEDNKSAD